LVSPSVVLQNEDEIFVNNIIEKYSNLSKDVLIGISHLTDAYKITTKNEKIMGQKIDKKLAILETFLFDDKEVESISGDKLPIINRSQLIRYDAR